MLRRLTVGPALDTLADMAKHLIIDGYNLLGIRGEFGHGQGRSFEEVREQLLRELVLYRQRKGHAITCVFDGWQQGFQTGHREHRSGIEVVFSRRGERADDVIQRLSEEYGPDCAVVSSDREVVEGSRRHGAFVMSAAEFGAKLRGGGEKDHDVDGVVRRGPEKKGNPRKLPKALRQRNRRLRGF
jgi:predicted RNA-binding protein with PIN domain